MHSASTKFYDWHYKKYLRERNTLLLFSFRHRSLLTVHTDLHGRTASGCLQKSSFEMVFNVLVIAVWMSETESKRRPFKWDFTFWNKE